MPKLAMKAKLFGENYECSFCFDIYRFSSFFVGVKPKHKDFTPDDAIHFKKLTENKSFPAVVKNITSDPFDHENQIFEIVLFGKDEKIHEILIREDRALPI
jgi:hypothetical protein